MLVGTYSIDGGYNSRKNSLKKNAMKRITITAIIILWVLNIFALPKTVLTSPLHGVSRTQTSLTFIWSSLGEGTVTHALFLDTLRTVFSTGTSYNTGEDTVFQVPETLVPGTTYYWGVQSTDYNGTTGSIVRQFTVLEENRACGGSFITYQVSNANYNSEGLYIVDKNSDGFLDILSSRYGSYLGFIDNPSGALDSFEIEYFRNVSRGADIYPLHFSEENTLKVLLANASQEAIYCYTLGNEIFRTVLDDNTYDPRIVHADDLDGDGDGDAIVAFDIRTIAWYENLGGDTWGPRQEISTQMGGATQLLTADFDNDGDIDIVARASTIGWFENDGNGNFNPTPAYTIDIYSSFMDIADMDNDGDYDIVAGSTRYNEINLKWYENNGNGEFAVMHYCTTKEDRVEVLCVADMDNDSDMDVISAYSNYEFFWHENDGSGNFLREHIILSEATRPTDIRVADFDRDGDVDITFNRSTKPYIIENGSPVVVITDSAINVQTYSAQIAGFINFISNEGISSHGVCWDTISTPTIEDNVVNDGEVHEEGSYRSLILGLSPNKTYYARTYAINHNGIHYGEEVSFTTKESARALLYAPSYACGAGKTNTSFSWQAFGEGTVSCTIYLDTVSNPFLAGSAYNVDDVHEFSLPDTLLPGKIYYWGVEVADNNGVMQSAVNQFTAVNENQGGLFINNESVNEITNLGYGIDVCFADFDNDGDADLAVSSIALMQEPQRDEMFIYTNNGHGQFHESFSISSPLGIRQMETADIDRDGLIDIVVDQGNYIQWYKSLGDGTVASPQRIHDDGLFACADIDNDGDIDVVCTTTELYWSNNLGEGEFEGMHYIDQDYRATWIELADINQDGYIDITTAHKDSSGFFVYINLGNGLFAEKLQYAQDIPEVRSVVAEDFDDDGDIDLIFVAWTDGVYWMENDGNDNFSQAVSLYNASGTYARLIALDVDSDTDEDVFIINNDTYGGAYLLENIRGQSVSKTAQFGDATTVKAADIDGDGDLDIATAYGFDGLIRWYENFDKRSTPTVITYPATDVSSYTATGNAKLAHGGDSEVSEYGICWNTDGNPTVEDNVSTSDTILSNLLYSSPLTGLNFNTTNYYRAYAINSFGIGYGEVFEFTTKDPQRISLALPHNNMEISTSSVTFTWHSKGVGTRNHILYIDTVQNPFEHGNQFFVGTDTSFTTTFDLEVGKNYYWGVSLTDDEKTIQSVAYKFNVLSNQLGGVFNQYERRTLEKDWRSAPVFDFVDYNKDGFMDVVASYSSNSAPTYLFEFNGYAFENKGQILNERYKYVDNLHFCDVNKDGLSDLLFITDQDVLLRINEGNGSFRVADTIYKDEAGSSIRKLETEDIDFDGHLDIIISKATPVSKPVWYKNDGEGNFSELNFFGTERGTTFDCADYTGDGAEDFLYTNSTELYIVENNGDGALNLLSTYTYSDYFSIKDHGDIDSDGDLDFIAHVPQENIIYWFENDGTGTFTNKFVVSDSIFSIPWGLSVDMDSDGDVDFLAWYGKTVVWFENVNHGTNFVEHLLVDGSENIENVLVNDIDKDGDMDVFISTNYGLSNLWWFENHTKTIEPQVSSIEVTALQSSAATIAGAIFSEGNSAITSHGFCWNTNGNPTIEDFALNLGSATEGLYSAEITELIDCREYFVRAYAQNSAGVGYGEELIFTTQDSIAPVVSWTHGNQILEVATVEEGGALPDYTSMLTVTDNCSSSNEITLSQLPFAQTIVQTDTIQIHLTANDISGNYASDSFLVVLSESPYQEIPLVNGWNMLSSYINYENAMVNDIFPNISLLKTEEGFYNADLPDYLNTLIDFTAGKAYLLYSENQENIRIFGSTQTYAEPTVLEYGWNFIGIPVDSVYNIANVPAEIEVIKNFDSFYEKGGSLNTLYELTPGSAYFIYVNSECIIEW